MGPTSPNSLSKIFRLALLCAVVAGLSSLLAPSANASSRYVSTKAPYAVIMDAESGDILFEKEARVPIPPASMSKLMTAAVVLDLIQKGEIGPDTLFAVSEKAWRTGGSKMFVLVDTQIRVEDLLKGLIVQSGNDAAVVLAENIAGSEEAFARLMTQRAREWGLQHSRFSNPSGQTDEGQRMSAIDLARLARRIWTQFPDYRYIFGMKTFTWSDIEQRNRNPLLDSFNGADGMKTGHTEEAGWSIVGTAEREGRRFFIVAAGLSTQQSRADEADRLMRIAFEDFATRTFFEAGEVVAEAEVFGGQKDVVPLRIDAPLRFTRHRRVLDQADAKVIYTGPLTAPVRKGEQVAILEVSLPDEPTREYPLYVAETVRGLSPTAKIGLGVRVLFTPPETAARP